jgi:hypothetical protein
MITQLAMTREVRMVASNGDDRVSRPRKPRIGIGTVQRYMAVDNDHLERHDREPGKGKITVSEVHNHLVKRVDSGAVTLVLDATKRRLTKMQWLVFVALHFGYVADKRGILRAHPCRIAGRLPTDREVATHYDRSERTVADYDGIAKRVFFEEAREEEERPSGGGE